jgi:hypothetical protein
MTQTQIKREIEKAVASLERAQRWVDEDNRRVDQIPNPGGSSYPVSTVYPLSCRLGSVIERLENLLAEEF